MKKIIVLLMISNFYLLAGSGKSQPTASLADTYKTTSNAMLVNVKGMVCDFCAQGLKKKFGKISEVEMIDVDLESGNVLIKLKEGKNLDDATVKKAVMENGLEVVSISKKS